MKKIVLAIPFVLMSVNAWAEAKIERDPFVDLSQKNSGLIVEDDWNRQAKQPEIRPRVQVRPAPKVSPIAPKLNVLGLVTNSRQPKAIVAGEKSTFIVAQGDKLGDYRVARIDRSGITLAFKQNRYQIPLGQ